MVSVIVDTDIGPDCDDAGALAVLHGLAGRGIVKILAIGNCRFYSEGSACIDAINRYYGRPFIPVGETKHEAFEKRPEWEKYNRYIATHYPNRYQNGEAEDVVPLYRKALAAQPDGSVTFISIGPFTNLSDLLNSAPDEWSTLGGRSLVGRKVLRLYSMAGNFSEEGRPGLEWNVTEDVPAARNLAENWPTPVIFAPYEAGKDVVTGKRFFSLYGGENPVRKAYELFCGRSGRSSWDPITVYAGVMGPEDLFRFSPAGDIRVDEKGGITFKANEKGRFRYLIREASCEVVAQRLEEWICMPRKSIQTDSDLTFFR